MTDDICGKTAKSTGEPCTRPAGWGTDSDGGPCKFHAGTSRDGESHEGNDWAAKHGAWAESFVTDFLREEEIDRVEDATELLGEPESAQDVGRTAAAIALEQFRRTGDDRFLRRFQSICDKFQIAPSEEVRHEHEGAETVINLPESVTEQWQQHKQD